MRGKGLLIAGTSSDVGKSVLTTGICRWLHRRGIRVAPFKAQNMSNNSAVAQIRGVEANVNGEIGRAQAVQAEACGVPPDVRFNPILLKPESDDRSQLVILGKASGYFYAHQFVSQRAELRRLVLATLDELRHEYDVVICEGAGSPAEINLRSGDLANMGLAEPARLPTIVVGDVNLGGVFAALYGTMALLDPSDQSLISGFILNKFRGNLPVLQPGIDSLRNLTGRQTIGVVPWHPDLWLDSEDAVPYGLVQRDNSRVWLRIVVIRLPHISNATDIDPLAAESGVGVVVTADPNDIAEADIVIIPGTKTTVQDLDWMRENGFVHAILAHRALGKPIMGICGGFQMLGQTIDDLVESGRTAISALGLLQIRTRFEPAKSLRNCSGSALGVSVTGYEIHHGQVSFMSPNIEPFLKYDDGQQEGAISCDGGVIGTHWHGIFESDEFRWAFLSRIARLSGREPPTRETQTNFRSSRKHAIELAGELVEQHLDTELLWQIIEEGPPKCLPIITPRLGMLTN